jgi:hypothetical protein
LNRIEKRTGIHDSLAVNSAKSRAVQGESVASKLQSGLAIAAKAVGRKVTATGLADNIEKPQSRK